MLGLSWYFMRNPRQHIFFCCCCCSYIAKDNRNEIISQCPGNEELLAENVLFHHYGK